MRVHWNVIWKIFGICAYTWNGFLPPKAAKILKFWCYLASKLYIFEKICIILSLSKIFKTIVKKNITNDIKYLLCTNITEICHKNYLKSEICAYTFWLLEQERSFGKVKIRCTRIFRTSWYLYLYDQSIHIAQSHSHIVWNTIQTHNWPNKLCSYRKNEYDPNRLETKLQW